MFQGSNYDKNESRSEAIMLSDSRISPAILLRNNVAEIQLLKEATSAKLIGSIFYKKLLAAVSQLRYEAVLLWSIFDKKQSCLAWLIGSSVLWPNFLGKYDKNQCCRVPTLRRSNLILLRITISLEAKLLKSKQQWLEAVVLRSHFD